MSKTIECSVVGRAWDAPTVAYTISPPESIIGVEITDFEGRLPGPRVGVFITCGNAGRKVFLTADESRGLADTLTAFADMLDAGATSADVS